MIAPAQVDPVTEQAERWVVRLASGDIEPRELDAFTIWRAAAPEHRIAFDRERALWQSLEGAQAAFATALPTPRRRVRRWGRVVTPGRVLAAVTVAAAIVLAIPAATIRLRADALADVGEIRTIGLPDGSTAMLDSGAAIAVRFGPGERRIELLRGQAWFDVRHGDRRPFRVAAMGGVTQDVGTAFEVDRSRNAVTIGVTQGAVRVTAPEDGDALLLTASERARYEEGGPAIMLVPGTASGIATWRRGLIVIDGQSVGDAIEEIARYRAGPTFTFADTSNRPKISGVFRIGAPDEALATLAEMGGLRLTTLPGGVAILRR